MKILQRMFFGQRVVADWNRLSQHVADALSTYAFKTDSTSSEQKDNAEA